MAFVELLKVCLHLIEIPMVFPLARGGSMRSSGVHRGVVIILCSLQVVFMSWDGGRACLGEVRSGKLEVEVMHTVEKQYITE